MKIIRIARTPGAGHAACTRSLQRKFQSFRCIRIAFRAAVCGNHAIAVGESAAYRVSTANCSGGKSDKKPGISSGIDELDRLATGSRLKIHSL